MLRGLTDRAGPRPASRALTSSTPAGLEIEIDAGLDAMAALWWHGLTAPPAG